jgi:hypothetical protein
MTANRSFGAAGAASTAPAIVADNARKIVIRENNPTEIFVLMLRTKSTVRPVSRFL